MPVRVLLDTSVVWAGFVSRTGASRRLLEAALAGRIDIFASTALMVEYEAVLLRPETLHRAKASVGDALGFLDGLCKMCQPVAIRISWRPQSLDIDDDLVIDAAVNGRVDTIATFNLRDLRVPAARFGIKAELPAQTLGRTR